MRKPLIIFFVLAMLCPPTLSRQQQPSARGPLLIDSFGEIQISDLMARLDNFAIELQNAPTSKGFIVAYAAKNKFVGWPIRRANLSLNYLVETRGIDAARLS